MGPQLGYHESEPLRELNIGDKDHGTLGRGPPKGETLQECPFNGPLLGDFTQGTR